LASLSDDDLSSSDQVVASWLSKKQRFSCSTRLGAPKRGAVSQSGGPT